MASRKRPGGDGSEPEMTEPDKHEYEVLSQGAIIDGEEKNAGDVVMMTEYDAREHTDAGVCLRLRHAEDPA